jgi:hypothetical protein
MVLGERSPFYPTGVLTKSIKRTKVKSSLSNVSPGRLMDMLTQDDVTAVDDSLADLPALLLKGRLALKQKRGYKAGKLSASRNWCHIVGGDTQPRICTHNVRGQLKTWKLFARFNTGQPPPWPWDKPQRREVKRPQGMISGDDVWGVSYEDIRDWSRTATGRQVIERLAADLGTSFSYSRQHYC